MSGAALVWCPFPDAESARAAVARLLDEGLIACANIIGTIESHFTWQGARGSASEAGVLLKTRKECLNELVNRLGALHPYDTPAIIGWEAAAAHPATLAWLAASCAAPLPGAPPDAAQG